MYIGTTLLPSVTGLRIVGITFTPDLYWDAQCDIVFKNAACMTGTIQRFVNTLNVDCQKMIFHVFVLPRVRYCLPVWDNMSTGIQSSLDRVLLRAIRVITNNHSADFNRDSLLAIVICYIKFSFRAAISVGFSTVCVTTAWIII